MNILNFCHTPVPALKRKLFLTNFNFNQNKNFETPLEAIGTVEQERLFLHIKSKLLQKPWIANQIIGNPN